MQLESKSLLAVTQRLLAHLFAVKAIDFKLTFASATARAVISTVRRLTADLTVVVASSAQMKEEKVGGMHLSRRRFRLLATVLQTAASTACLLHQ